MEEMRESVADGQNGSMKVSIPARSQLTMAGILSSRTVPLLLRLLVSLRLE